VVVRHAALALVALFIVAGCAKSQHSTVKPRTEAQRDSALARSPLPGAPAVGRAFEAADQARGHAAQIDSLTR